MSGEFIALTDCLLTKRHPQAWIAFHEKQYIHADAFYGAVSYWASQLESQPFLRYALYTEDAYPFAVLLFALFHAGKEVWIVGNNRPGTAQLLQQHGCHALGDWDSGYAFDYRPATSYNSVLPLSPLSPSETKLVIFTSGSNGQPKPIEKSLSQFQHEIAALERQWGMRLRDSEVLSTVSHQHIYGLLFRVLWPLCAGRCFHSPNYLNPEILANSVNPGLACWIASPAHLKRLDQNSPWDGIARLTAIFSSGGALPDAAREQICQRSGRNVIEIYGSTETGGIAWKTQGRAWALFPGMSLTALAEGWELNSPYLHDNQGYLLDDRIEMLGDGHFILNGRSDRIVKIEEKRLSLTELEQHLCATPWVEEAYGLTVSQKRDTVCAVLVLTETGIQELSRRGRNHFIKLLRTTLESWFVPVHLPRKWLFVNKVPLTPQGKTDAVLLTGLLDVDKQKFPLVHDLNLTADGVQFKVVVPHMHELVYFPDHFPGYPILPGVVQLAWVEHFGKLFFAVGETKKPFSHLEVVKFIKIIRPGDELTLVLKWQEGSGELQFNFSSGSEGYSSGRMVYKSN